MFVRLNVYALLWPVQFSLDFLFLGGTILRIEIIQFNAILRNLFLFFFIGAFKWSIKPSQYIFYCVTRKSVRKNIDNAFVSESCNTEWIWHHLREQRRQKRVDWFSHLWYPSLTFIWFSVLINESSSIAERKENIQKELTTSFILPLIG